MPRITQRILSPEEFAQRLAKQAAGLPLDSNVVIEHERAKTKAAEEKLKAVEARVKKSGELARDIVNDVLERHGVEPLDELITLLTERYPEGHETLGGQYVMGREDRAQMWLKLLEFRVPKLKAVEEHKSVKASVTINIVRFGDAQGQKIVEQREMAVIDVEKTSGVTDG